MEKYMYMESNNNKDRDLDIGKNLLEHEHSTRKLINKGSIGLRRNKARNEAMYLHRTKIYDVKENNEIMKKSLEIFNEITVLRLKHFETQTLVERVMFNNPLIDKGKLLISIANRVQELRAKANKEVEKTKALKIVLNNLEENIIKLTKETYDIEKKIENIRLKVVKCEHIKEKIDKMTLAIATENYVKWYELSHLDISYNCHLLQSTYLNYANISHEIVGFYNVSYLDTSYVCKINKTVSINYAKVSEERVENSQVDKLNISYKSEPIAVAYITYVIDDKIDIAYAQEILVEQPQDFQMFQKIIPKRRHINDKINLLKIKGIINWILEKDMKQREKYEAELKER